MYRMYLRRRFFALFRAAGITSNFGDILIGGLLVLHDNGNLADLLRWCVIVVLTQE